MSSLFVYTIFFHKLYQMEKHVFRAYDSNNDGYIDFVEFMVIFYIMADGSPEEVLGKIFRVFDVNSDGSITNKEMQRLVKDMYGLLKTEDPDIAAKVVYYTLLKIM